MTDQRKPVERDLTIVEQVRTHKGALNLHEFAELTSISYKTAFAMARDKRLPSIRIGSSFRLDPVVVANWLEQQSA